MMMVIFERPVRGVSITRALALVDAGESLASVGRLLGVSREAIRLILKKSGRPPISIRMKEIKVAKDDAFRFRVDFARSLKAHLWTFGFAKCSLCGMWKIRCVDFPKVFQHHCRKCNTDSQFKRYGKRPELRGISQSERIKILRAERSIR